MSRSSTQTFAAAPPATTVAPAKDQSPVLVDLSPAVQSVLAPADSLATAEIATRKLALGHYENFSVATILLPKNLRQDFFNIYAFCRTADDLADSSADHARALDRLNHFADQTRAAFSGSTDTALFIAVSSTIQKHQIPIQPFLNLIDAFEQDQRIARYETFSEVVNYCRRSADPVGRLVLYLCGYRDEVRQQLSDFTCTGLQLANFWQDVRRDLTDLDRIYLPRETMRQFDVAEDDLRAEIASDKVRAMIKFEVDRAETFFARGEALLPMLDRSVRSQIALFGQGGRAILEAIRRQNYDTIAQRPTLSGWQKGRLIFSALLNRTLTAIVPESSPSREDAK